MRLFSIIVLVLALLSGNVRVFAQTSDPAFDTALAAALARHADRTDLFSYREAGRTIDPTLGGIVYLELVQPSGEPVPGLIDWLVAVKQNGVWALYLPGDAGYQAALETFPDTFRATFDDAPYRPQADLALLSDAQRHGYGLPWEHGQWGTVTRSFHRHGTGQVDFDLTGRSVAAAKDGTIVYANDRYDANAYSSGSWWYWNTVIIKHGEHEYSLYGHLEPGSIPAAIKASCSDDLSRPNCDYPVQAGDIIAMEGTTGYSSNYHLHLELGQSYGIAAYPDLRDVDLDGDRAEAVYTAYIYATQNVGFSGFSANEAAEWPYGTLLQASHQPSILDVAVRNGDFSLGTDGWRPSGQVNWSVEDGVMRFLRLNTSEPPDWAGFYQELNGSAPAHYPLEATFELGNSSGVEKVVLVSLMNSSGSTYGEISCRFVIAPNTPLQPYAMRGTINSVWANVRLQFFVNPPDSAPAALVDQVAVHRIDAAPDEAECISPTSS